MDAGSRSGGEIRIRGDALSRREMRPYRRQLQVVFQDFKRRSDESDRPGPYRVRRRLAVGGRWIRTFGSRTRHQAVRPRRGRFPVIGSSPHWPGGTGISNLRPLAGWISALERGRFQGHKQKRKLKSVAPFARNRKFESISLQQRVRVSGVQRTARGSETRYARWRP